MSNLEKINEIKGICKKILLLLDSDFGNQQYYSPIARDIYKLVNKIYQSQWHDKIYKEKINFSSLARQYVDETTQFSSPVLWELEKLSDFMNKIRFSFRCDELLENVENRINDSKQKDNNKEQLISIKNELNTMKIGKPIKVIYPRMIVDSWDYGDILGLRLLELYEEYKILAKGNIK